MKNILLIGFDYTKSPNWSTLPGIIIDLYLMYKIFNILSPDNICVITDIIYDIKTNKVKQAIIDQIVDANILEFIESIKERQQHTEFSNYENFKNTISKYFINSGKLIIYYTGHSENGYIILPDETKLSFNEFRDIIISSSKFNSDILIITDCCEGTGMGFPYQLILNNNKPIYRLTFDSDKIFLKQNIIYISSSMYDEKSATTRDGSFFTQELYNLLFHRIRNLSDILSKLISKCNSKHPQTAGIHSSHPNIKLLWGWIFGYPDLKIIYDINTYIIYINRHTIDKYVQTKNIYLHKNINDDSINVTFI